MQEDRTRERSEKFSCRDAMYFKKVWDGGSVSLYILATLGVLGSWAMVSWMCLRWTWMWMGVLYMADMSHGVACRYQ